MKKTILISLIALMISSCVKEATIKLPEQERKLVVTCFISPDDAGPVSAVVRLSSSRYTYDTLVDNFEVTDANILLSNGTENVVLAYNFMKGCYESVAPYPIEPGKTYYLTVTTPGGKYANASTTVPVEHLTIQRFDVSLKDTTYNSINFDSFAEVKDVPGKVNYVNFMYEYHYSHRSYQEDGSLVQSTYEGPSYFSNDERTSKDVYSDTYKEGNIYHGDTIFKASVSLSAMNCSKEFYLYHQSVKNADSGGGNPFADPALIYSNMVNGFGCFGAFTRSSENRPLK